MSAGETATTTISAPVRELLVTATVVVAIVASLTVMARIAFPDPTIRGSHCPASLGIKGTAECVSEWHRSHDERRTNQANTVAAVILVTVLGVATLTRWRGPASPVRLDLALAMLGGLFLGPVLGVVGDGGLLLGVLTGSGLVVASELVPQAGPRWQRFAAVGLGFLAFWVIGLVSLVFFYAGR